MAMTNELYEDSVFKIKNALGKLWHKLLKEQKFPPEIDEFVEAVKDALEEGFEPPKQRGGQKGNSNARKRPQTVNVEVMPPDDNPDLDYAVAIGVMDD